MHQALAPSLPVTGGTPLGEYMTADHRQRLNVRAIRVTLASARRHATPEQVELCNVRARQLLENARDQATAPSVITEIEALQADLDRVSGAAQQRRG